MPSAQALLPTDRRHFLIATAMAASVTMILACGGGGGGGTTNPTPNPTTTPDTRTVLASPSFSTNVQEIFERRGCTNSSCHGSSAQAGLTLTRGSSYAALVGVPARSEPIVRVIPGDPNGSYLVIKLEGRQTVGSRMPQTGAALDSIDLSNVRNWIAQGAANN
jgi:hypothetical protein